MSIEGKHIGTLHGCRVVEASGNVIQIAAANSLPESVAKSTTMSFCIDRDIYQGGMNRARSNLRQLVLGPLPRFGAEPPLPRIPPGLCLFCFGCLVLRRVLVQARASVTSWDHWVPRDVGVGRRLWE